LITGALRHGGFGIALALAPAAAAQPPSTAAAEAAAAVPARFALILGVNRSVDPEVPVLRYADDDAAKYQDLFRGLGARTYLVTRLDANTERLHRQAAAEAREPTRAELTRTIDQLQADVRVARERGVRTILYVVYSGHGNIDDGRAYLSLEDGRLFGSDLDALIFDRVGASEQHLIVDACYASLLTNARGPGGSRHELHDFTARAGIRARSNLGMLFSTSSGRESHEWAGVESGVFSHEVRSGLYGAADADGDGLVTYPEIAAFVERANAAIPGERFRPDVYARPPQGDAALVDLRGLAGHRIEVQRSEHAHYALENSLGVQVAEFHNGPDQTVVLIEPAQSLSLYLRRLDDGTEFVVPMGREIVRVADLSPAPTSVAFRGAAANAFGTLFTLPFGPSWVHKLRSDPLPEMAADTRASMRDWIGWTLVGVGLGAASAGLAAAVSAEQTRGALTANSTQVQAAEVNRTLDTRRWETVLGFGIGAAAAATGTAVLLWPRPARLQLSAGGLRLDLIGSF